MKNLKSIVATLILSIGATTAAHAQTAQVARSADMPSVPPIPSTTPFAQTPITAPAPMAVPMPSTAQTPMAAPTPPAAPITMAVPTPIVAPAPPAVPTPAVMPTPPATPTSVVQTISPSVEQPGKIIFFRPGRLTGAVYTYHVVTVGADGNSVAESPRVCSLPNGRFCVYEATPGIYNFNIRGPMAVNLDQDRIRLEIEPGQTYYIEQTVRMGLITGGFRLVPSTLQEFERRKPREWKAGEQ